MITLGAVVPGGSYWSLGQEFDPPYWLPCLTRAEEGGGEPHCYFIKHPLELVVQCPSCRPDRNRITERRRYEGPPWGKGEPFWSKASSQHPIALAAWRLAMEEEWNERSAIREYLGNVSRAEAEHEAYADLARAMRAPA